MSVNVGKAVGYLDLDTSKFKAGLKDALSTLREFTNQSNSAGTRFEALGSSLKIVGRTITTAVSLPLLALGAGAIKTASDFEAGMSKVSALSGATGDDLKMLEDKAREMGATTKYSATESAEALSYMALAGWDAEQMAAGLEPSLKLAGAAGMDLALATDIVTDTMSMFGMEASEATKMTDMLAYAQANSNTDVQQLGEALKYCGASANAMGYDLADTTALLGTFADQGLKGSSAGTTLNAMFRDMKAKAKDGAIAIGDTNVAIVDANGNYRDMTDILADVEKATEGMTQAERDMALSSVWGTEALKGVNMAFQAGIPTIKEFEEGIRSSDGAAGEMYDTMQNNLKGAIDNLKSAFEGVMITIGQRLIPIFQNLVEGITNVFTWFNNLNPAIQNVIIGVGGFLAILGPLLLIVGNVIIFIVKLSTSISALVTFFSAGGAGAGILSAAIGALSGPIGIAIGVITALIAVGVLLYKNWDTIKAKASEIWNSIKDTIMKAMNWLGEQLGFNTEEIFAIITDAWNSIKDTLGATLDVISKTVSDAWEGIKEIIDMTVGVIFTTVKKAWDDIKDALSMIGDAIQQLIDGDWEGAKETIRQMNEKIKEIVSMAWDKIKVTLSQAGEAIKNIAEQAWNKIKVTINQAMENIKTAIKNGWENIKNATKTACDNVKKIAKTVFGGIKDDISKALSNVFNTAKSWWGKITNIFKNPIKAVVNLVKNGAKALLANNFIESQESLKENDYTKARFDYARAKQTTVSDVIATNYSMIEGLKDFAKGIKTDNKQANVNTENSISINLNIDKFVNERKQDVKEFMEEMAFEVRRQRMSFGGVR